ncbi:MAG: matrixin family metalloprotease, partial [Solirubrobacterales bacterium]|nr:matrixin family metalloprotease [Solirubrobacterales bacterium]
AYGAGASAAGTVTIADAPGAPDAPLTISIAAQQVIEGDKGTVAFVVTVRLSRASATPVTVSYATGATGTGAGFALAGKDYKAAFGTLTFAAGQTSATFTVSVIGDRLVEGDETFGVTLTSPTGGATLVASSAVMTIVDNERLLLASAAGPGDADTLAPAAIAPALAAAIAQWTAAGADPAALAAVSVVVGDLPGLALGSTTGTRIVLDADAAGWGWHTDPSTAPPADRIDLVSVLVHELGHILGLEHAAHGAMEDAIAPGAVVRAGDDDAHASWIRSAPRGWIRSSQGRSSTFVDRRLGRFASTTVG